MIEAIVYFTVGLVIAYLEYKDDEATGYIPYTYLCTVPFLWPMIIVGWLFK